MKPMKKLLLLFASCALVCQVVSAQNTLSHTQRISTDPVKGVQVEIHSASNAIANGQQNTLKPVAVPGTNWHAIDAAAIGNVAKVSAQAQKTAAGWTLNNQRLSLYGTSNLPLWEVPLTIQTTEESVDMTEDGSKIANGYSHSIEVYTPASSTPIWSTTISRSVTGIQISGDGLKVFVGASNLPASDSSFVYCYTVGQSTPVWIKSFPGRIKI